MERRYRVYIERFAEKQLSRLPEHIQERLYGWTEMIEESGISEMRRISGYHDEPLKGDRIGQRSSRLNRGYRVIYEEQPSGNITIIAVMEISKHAY